MPTTKCSVVSILTAAHTDQILTLQQIFEKSWEYARDVNLLFVDFEKAHNRVPCGKLGEC